MGPLVKGDVVVFPFPFTNLTETKRRPALVVHPLNGTDTMLCMITRTDHADGWSVPLIDNDFQAGSQ